jgi:hypothetical protein
MSQGKQNRCHKSKADCARRLRCESLETRHMLSANLGQAPELTSPSQADDVPAMAQAIIDTSLGARDQALAISAVHVLIDGRELTLTSLDQPLVMEVGAALQIVGIEYRLQGDEPMDGRIAFEGYLNKLKGSRVRTDYSDGRFGGHVQEGELPFGSSSHPGLSGTWTVEAGTESLTLVMVRYGVDEIAVEDRLTIRTQVGTPDFVISPDVKFRGSNQGLVAGRKIRIAGTWGNAGEGQYRSYAEVDIDHESDPTRVVWSGTQADVLGEGEKDAGEFLNKVRRDGFAKRWVPELGGKYTLKFYADPENHWAESNEDNNVVTLELKVEDLRQKVKGRDATRGFGVGHHSIQDAPAHDAALAAAASQATAHPTTSNDAEPLAPERTADESVLVAQNVQLTPQVSSPPAAAEVDPPGERADEWRESVDEVLSIRADFEALD